MAAVVAPRNIQDLVVMGKDYIYKTKSGINRMPLQQFNSLKSDAQAFLGYATMGYFAGRALTVFYGTVTIAAGAHAFFNLSRDRPISFIVNALFCALFGAMTREFYIATEIVGLAKNAGSTCLSNVESSENPDLKDSVILSLENKKGNEVSEGLGQIAELFKKSTLLTTAADYFISKQNARQEMK